MQQLSWRRPLARWLLVFGCVAVVLAIGTSSAFPLRADSGPLLRWFRKSIHVVEYGVLSLVLVWALTRPGERPRLRHVVGAIIGAVVVGCVDEWHQGMVPGRTGRGSDVGIDTLGAGLGQFLAWVVSRFSDRSFDSLS